MAGRNTGDIDRTVYLQSIVVPGQADLVIRESAGGTDLSSTTLSIYPFHGGRMQRVFPLRRRPNYRVVGAQVTGGTYKRVWLDFQSARILANPELSWTGNCNIFV